MNFFAVIDDKPKESIPEHDAQLSSIRWHLSEGKVSFSLAPRRENINICEKLKLLQCLCCPFFIRHRTPDAPQIGDTIYIN